MKLIEVPIFNEDGSVKVTHLIGPDEAKQLLQFAINFLMSAGSVMGVRKIEVPEQMELPLQ